MLATALFALVDGAGHLVTTSAQRRSHQRYRQSAELRGGLAEEDHAGHPTRYSPGIVGQGACAVIVPNVKKGPLYRAEVRPRFSLFAEEQTMAGRRLPA